MYWECGTETSCECGTLKRGMDRLFVGRLLARFQYSLDDPLPAGPGETAINYWWSAIEEFARRKLTSPTDRLPALAGFAARIQRSELGEYHAGLWTGDLPASLLWCTSCPIDKASIPRVYIGPTWSWVSVAVQVNRPYQYDTVLAKVIHMRSHPKSKSMFGEITAAWIRIEGPTRNGILNWKRSGFALSSLPNVQFDVRLDSIVLGDDQNEDLIPHFGEVLLMVIAHIELFPYLEGLVLVKSQKQNGAFERLGKFTIVSKKMDEIGRGKGWKRKTVTII
jgi:hypothetical protein